MGRAEGKRPLGRPRRKLEDNLRQVGCDAGDWIDLVEDRNQWQVYVRAVMNLQVP